MEGGWGEEQYKADHEHYSMYYDLLCRSSSINNALFQMTTIDFDHFRHSKRVETAHLIIFVAEISCVLDGVKNVTNQRTDKAILGVG